MNGNGNDGTTPPDDTPDDWTGPTLDKPWRPVRPDQLIYLFDHGQPWCNDRASHPQHQPDDYPSLNHHVTECRSYGGWFEGWFEDARAGLNGPPDTCPRIWFALFGTGKTAGLTMRTDSRSSSSRATPAPVNRSGAPSRHPPSATSRRTSATPPM